MKLECLWDNINQEMHFCLKGDFQKKVSVKALCFTSIMRIKSFAGNATLARQEAYFHHIEPCHEVTLTPDENWVFEAKEFCEYDGYIMHPLRLSDGPKMPYVIIEDKGKLHFIDVDMDFSFTQPKQKVNYNPGSLAVKLPAPSEAILKDHQETVKASIIPKPYEITLSENKLSNMLTVDAHSSFAKSFKTAQYLVRNLWGIEKSEKIQFADESEKASIKLAYKELHNKESYEITTQSDGRYIILACHHSGFFYAFISLYQHLIYSQTAYDIKNLIDKPRFAYRCCHLDVARRYYPLEELKRFLREIAWFKINQLHLHFCDDEAWRIEIKALPELTQIGAFSGHDEKILPIHCTNWQKSGGYYTQEEIKDLISYAKNLNIDILPELDLPAHSYSALQSLPYLREDKKTPSTCSVQGYPDNVLNPALPQTYEFLETVLKELCPIFPYPFFHLGGDEVPHGAWMDSDLCKELAEKEGFAFTTENLQSYIMQKAQDILEKYGKKSCGWEEASHGAGFQQDKNGYVILWSDLQKAPSILEKGYNLVLSPGSHYYLDMAQGDDITDTGLSWAGSSDVQKTYLLEPILPEFEGYEDQIWGIQACIWGSDYNSYDDFHFMVYPRLMAVAETAWSKAENRNWPNFKQRLQQIRKIEKDNDKKIYFV